MTQILQELEALLSIIGVSLAVGFFFRLGWILCNELTGKTDGGVIEIHAQNIEMNPKESKN